MSKAKTTKIKIKNETENKTKQKLLRNKDTKTENISIQGLRFHNL